MYIVLDKNYECIMFNLWTFEKALEWARNYEGKIYEQVEPLNADHKATYQHLKPLN